MILSATTKPTLKNKFVAGRKGMTSSANASNMRSIRVHRMHGNTRDLRAERVARESLGSIDGLD